MRAYTVYLADIADAMEKIEEFTAGMTYDEFLHDDKTQSAVSGCSRSLVKRQNRSRCPSGRGTLLFPWREMAGMRDKLIHTYFGVDMMLVWRTVINRVPRLRQEIDRVIELECGR